jgi:hypothetical protein
MKYLQRRPRTFIEGMLPRIDRRGHSTRRKWGMDLLEKRGSASSGGSADDRSVHRKEARDDHEIHANEEYIWEVQKLPKDR